MPDRQRRRPACSLPPNSSSSNQVWTAEAYGSDAWTPLAWWGSRTSHVQLGTAVSQLSARPPTTLAMTAMTMDHLTGGRVILGIGTSNPQVVEGWYGQPYPRPLERTREYIDIVRAVIARREPVTYDGQHYQLPHPGGTGLGKPLRSILHPYRDAIPIYLGAEGQKNVALAAEIADGWNTIFFSPAMNDFYATALAEGFARPGARHTSASFDVVGGPMRIVVDDDLERAADDAHTGPRGRRQGRLGAGEERRGHDAQEDDDNVEGVRHRGILARAHSGVMRFAGVQLEGASSRPRKVETLPSSTSRATNASPIPLTRMKVSLPRSTFLSWRIAVKRLPESASKPGISPIRVGRPAALRCASTRVASCPEHRPRSREKRKANAMPMATPSPCTSRAGS